MLAWLISKVVSKPFIEESSEYIEKTVYVRSSFEITDPNEAVEISMVLSAHNVSYYGVEIPHEVFIDENQYEALPYRYKQYFEPKSLKFKVVWE